jgi:anti-anti-sigma factor
MSITTELKSNTLFINISGRFDFGMHTEFREATKLANENVKQIEINLSNTDYLDSSALGMLLVLHDKMKNDRNAVQIKNAKSDVKKILEIANFNKLFTII